MEAGTIDGHRVTVRSRAVVAACGAIQTPALLKRSGLTNRNIGRHLKLHPVTVVWGQFDEEVRPWEGTMQALYSDQHRDLHDGYGLKYETGPMHPHLVLGFLPWRGSGVHFDLMGALPNTTGVGILLRDRDGGEVRVGRDGEPVVRYGLSDFDRGHMRTGVDGAAQILEAAGREEDLQLAVQVGLLRPRHEGRSRGLHGGCRRVRVGAGPDADGLVPHHGQRADGRLAQHVGLHPGRRDLGRARPLRVRRLGVPDRVGREPDGLDRVDRPHDRARDRSCCALRPQSRSMRTVSRSVCITRTTAEFALFGMRR